MKTTFKLHNDFKRTAIDTNDNVTLYEVYQDLNDPRFVVLTKTVVTGTASVETYYLTEVADTAAFDTLWGNRTSLTYKNLIDINISDKIQ